MIIVLDMFNVKIFDMSFNLNGKTVMASLYLKEIPLRRYTNISKEVLQKVFDFTLPMSKAYCGKLLT